MGVTPAMNNSAVLREEKLSIRRGRIVLPLLFVLLLPTFMTLQAPKTEHPFESLIGQEC